jgi:hypothetical protein
MCWELLFIIYFVERFFTFLFHHSRYIFQDKNWGHKVAIAKHTIATLLKNLSSTEQLVNIIDKNVHIRKKPRFVSETMGAVQKQQHEMQAEQLQENQVMHDGNSITTTPAHDRLPFSGFRKEEYVRLILQSLFDMGFK